MSFQVTTAFVKQFSSNVWHLSQQKGSVLAGLVRSESQNSESSFYDNIGAVTAQKKVGRHSDTTYQDTPHGRRRVTTEDYFYSDLVDKTDKLRMINSPESEYAVAAKWALGRAMDDVIIDSALGTSSEGKEGGTSVVLPDTQKLGAVDGTSDVGAKLTVKTLRMVKKKFHQNEVDGEGEMYFALTAQQLDDLLADDQVINNDYATVKALVQGDVDTFMGFKFVRIERLPLRLTSASYEGASGNDSGDLGGSQTFAANARRCFAWKKEGVLLATADSVMGRIDELPGKHYSNQVYASMSIGGTRMEEAKVVEVLCSEA